MRSPTFCCDEPAWADECLRKFKVREEGVTMKEVGDYELIFKSNKQKHFKMLKERSGVEFSEMIFFDNQMNNINAESKLGVVCNFCQDGVTEEIRKNGVDAYARR